MVRRNGLTRCTSATGSEKDDNEHQERQAMQQTQHDPPLPREPRLATVLPNDKRLNAMPATMSAQSEEPTHPRK